MNATPTMLTFHGKADQGQLTALLLGANVRLVVDVRRFPGSRRHPYVATAELEQWLPTHGVEYRWEPRLGGRRRVPSTDTLTDPWWRVEAFRAYAARTRTEEFTASLGEVLTEVNAEADGLVAVMCSESLWWRCHRRLIADAAVLLHQLPVVHLGHDGNLTAHVVAAGARVTQAGRGYDLEP